jgi:parallel beta-helix repeat protein
MKRTIPIRGIILILLLSSLSFNTIGVEEVASTIIHVDDDGTADYTRIQDAIDNASDGDIVFVYSGTYQEHIIINKSIQLVGENNQETIIDGEGKDKVIIIHADNVVVTNFKIYNSGKGFDDIIIYEVDSGITIKANYVNISHNNFNNNYVGILLFDSNQVNIFQNYFDRTGGCIYNINSTFTQIIRNRFISTTCGIITGDTFQDIIRHNVLDDVYLFGLRLFNCSNGDIAYNNITGSNGFGILASNSSQNVIYNNSISIYDANNYKSFMLEKSHNNTIRGNYIYNSRWDGMLFFSSSNNNTIIDNTLTDNRNGGIIIAYSSGNRLEHNEVENTDGHSIKIYGGSKNNKIINNLLIGVGINVSGALHSGIDINEKSSHNVLTSNTIINHNLHGIKIYSHNNSIEKNIIKNNAHHGIDIENSNDNVISMNSIMKNEIGIYLEEISCKNHIFKNSIKENSDYGIFIEWFSKGNSIISNNFIDNNMNAYFVKRGNVWRRNYWQRPRILPYKIMGFEEQFEIDWLPRFLPVRLNNIFLEDVDMINIWHGEG